MLKLSMETIKLMQYIIMTLMLFTVIYKAYRKLYKPWDVKSKINDLSHNLTEQTAKEFTAFVASTDLPNELEIWNALRASWQLVNSCPGISAETKTSLRNTLLGRGVNL